MQRARRVRRVPLAKPSGELMTVRELANLLLVSPRYARRLTRRHVLRPVQLIRGQRYVVRNRAEAYKRKMRGKMARAMRAYVESSAVLAELEDKLAARQGAEDQ